jgi:hypothetical protein
MSRITSYGNLGSVSGNPVAVRERWEDIWRRSPENDPLIDLLVSDN